jgi:hypothetical protein
VANGIASLADAQGHLGLDPTKMSAASIAKLQRMLDGSAAMVEKVTGRKFSPEPALVAGLDTGTPVTKTFSARGRRRIAIPDLRVATTVVLDSYTLDAATGYDLGPSLDQEPAQTIVLSAISPFVTVRPLWTSQLVITGRWGFNPTPPEIIDVVLYATARKYKRSENSYGDQVADASGAAVNYFRQLPQDYQDAVNAYKRIHVGFVGAGLGA